MKNNSSTKKRVLVTGAAGFIGSNCLPILLSKGLEVHAADIVVPKRYSSGAHWHSVDLLDSQKTAELIAGIRPTHLLHFAWFVKPGDYWSSIENVRWLEGSSHMMRAFQKAGGRRVVMAGTCMEYDSRFGYCSEFATPLVPSSLYATCKNALQHVLKDFSREASMSCAWGRIFFLYGPHEDASRLVSSVILNLMHDKPALCTHGNQIRDFLYVKDVASAFVSLLLSNVDGPVNIASGKPIALKEIVFLIADKLGKRNLVRLGALTQSMKEPPVIFADARRLSDEVVWEPKYDINSGIGETIEWWQERSKEKSRSRQRTL